LSDSTTSPHYHIDSVPSLQKELKESITEVEQIQEASRVRNDSSKEKGWFTIKEEEVSTTVTLDGYFIHNNANFK
jgi:hypothetical protein